MWEHYSTKEVFRAQHLQSHSSKKTQMKTMKAKKTLQKFKNLKTTNSFNREVSIEPDGERHIETKQVQELRIGNLVISVVSILQQKI